MSSSAQLEISDADLGVALPMSGLPAIILPPLELEHVDLGLLALAHDFAQHLGAFHQRCAGLDALPVRGEEHLVEGDLGARFGAHEREPEGLSLFGSELFPACADDWAHADPRVRVIFARNHPVKLDVVGPRAKCRGDWGIAAACLLLASAPPALFRP